MKKITKKECIETLCNQRTIFLGVSHKEHCEDEIRLAQSNLEHDILNGVMMNTRSAKPYSKGVMFSGGSYCAINDKRTECYRIGSVLKIRKYDGYGNLRLEMYYYLCL